MNVRHAVLASVTLVLVALGGCTSKPSATAPAPGGAATSPAASQPASVSGHVLDQDANPLPAAQVSLSAIKPGVSVPSVTADSDGAYRFSQVPSGGYVLTAWKSGWLANQRSIDVAAGESAQQVDVYLAKVDEPRGFNITLIHRGIFGCGASVAPDPGLPTFPPCAILSVAGEVGAPDLSRFDAFEQRYYLDQVPVAQWSTTILEMKWDAAQPAAKQMAVRWQTPHCHDEASVASQPKCLWGTASGASPLQVRVERDAAIRVILQAWQETNGQDFNSTGGSLFSAVSSAANVGDLPANAGLQVQQEFTQYVTVFFNMVAPPGFTAMK